MASIFTKIINGEIPSYKIAEDDNFIAILDAFPLVEGHVLVIPKLEVDYIFDIEDIMLSKLMLFSKRVAQALEKSIDCERIGISVIGLEVRHTHIHLIPINTVGDMNFSRPKINVEPNRMKEILDQIKANL